MMGDFFCHFFWLANSWRLTLHNKKHKKNVFPMKNLHTLVIMLFFAVGSLCAQTPDNGGSGGEPLIGGCSTTNGDYYEGVFYI